MVTDCSEALALDLHQPTAWPEPRDEGAAMASVRQLSVVDHNIYPVIVVKMMPKILNWGIIVHPMFYMCLAVPCLEAFSRLSHSRCTEGIARSGDVLRARWI